MRFLESFLLFSLMAPSDPYSDSDLAEIRHNINAVAVRGRDPGLHLQRAGKKVLLRDWANEIFEQILPGSELLDQGGDTSCYASALGEQRAKIDDPDLTPSARMLADMKENREEFYHFALRMSRQHQQWFAERPLEADKLARQQREAAASLERQREIEASDQVSFETFLQNYFAQT